MPTKPKPKPKAGPTPSLGIWDLGRAESWLEPNGLGLSPPEPNAFQARLLEAYLCLCFLHLRGLLLKESDGINIGLSRLKRHWTTLEFEVVLQKAQGDVRRISSTYDEIL